MEKSIYELKLHERTKVLIVKDYWSITRVPGGFIYYQLGVLYMPIFVPFNNEFKTTKKQLEFDEFKDTLKEKFNFKKSLIELGVSEQVASDWLKVRAKKKAANTQTAFTSIANQIKITTHKPDDCIKMAVKKNWAGFESEWYFNAIKSTTNGTTEKKLSTKF